MNLPALVLTLCLVTVSAHAAEGIATYYSTKSCQREGTSGIFTANGERYSERAMTCATRSREFGTRYKVTNLDTGRSIIVRQNDFGPGRGPAKRGVIIDLTPAAFDAIGGKRGITKRGVEWGEARVTVTKMDA